MTPTSSVNISTKRTAVNITVVGYVIFIINKLFGWNLSLSDDTMMILMPVIGIVFGIGYRLSRALTTKFPALGYVLFGSGQEPSGVKPIGE